MHLFWKMIKILFSTPFHSFPTIPILSLPGGPGDVPIVSDQNTFGWYIGLHLLVDRRAHELQQLFNDASCVYMQARRNGWVVSVAYALSLDSEIRGRLHRNHHLRSRGGTAVTACCVEKITRCYTRLFFLPIESIERLRERLRKRMRKDREVRKKGKKQQCQGDS